MTTDYVRLCSAPCCPKRWCWRIAVMTPTGSGSLFASREHGRTFRRKDPICFSPYLYRARNLVERFFNKIKQCRRVATRYDKLAANYLAFVKLASIRIWLRANESTTLVSRISYPALARKIFRFAVCRNQLPSFRGALLNSGLPEFSNIDGASPESVKPQVR